MDAVEYKGIEYPLRLAFLNGDRHIEECLVGTEELGKALLTDDMTAYKDEEAKQIDEMIYCYVEPHIFEGMEQSEFDRYIRNNFY